MENNPDNVSVDAGNTKEESSDQIERNERLCDTLPVISLMKIWGDFSQGVAYNYIY